MSALNAGEFFGRCVGQLQCDDFTISETSYSGGATLPWHSHEDSYLTFVLSGGYRERLRGLTRDCGPDSVVVHPAGEGHEDHFANNRTRCLNVVIGSGFARRAAAAMLPFDRSAVVSSRGAISAGHRLRQELRRGDDVSPIAVEAIVLEFLAGMARSDATGRRIPSWLTEAAAIVGKRFAEKLTLRDIAAAVGVHPVNLAREFRRCFGVTVGERIRELRVANARERIAAGESLAIVAAATGFADQSHFTRTFVRSTGTTPARFRHGLR